VTTQKSFVHLIRDAERTASVIGKSDADNTGPTADWVELRRLKIGSATVDLRFERGMVIHQQ
jgi:hypothetical protein